MYRPLSLFIGIRYTRNKRDNRFISLISLMSMMGIALGMMVLITVLSVLNGFDREIKKSIFKVISPITVGSMSGSISNWQSLVKPIQAHTDVIGVAPFIYGQGLLQFSELTEPVMVMGVIPEKEKTVSGIDANMMTGHFADLVPNHFAIVLGEHLAQQLGVKVGDKVTLVTPKRSSFSMSNMTPHFNSFTVTGIFKAAGGGFDTKLAYVNLYDAQKAFELGSQVTALHVNITDIFQAPLIAKQLQNEFNHHISVSNWTYQLGDFFENISSTKTMMFFIFLLIIVVAVFNLICTLVMVVKNKISDIAILRTIGASRVSVMMIFVIHGAAIGLGGIVLGILSGVGLALHVTDVVNWIQHFFHLQLISSNVYYVDFLPSELHWSDVWKISGVAFALSLLATVYPAWNAARQNPVEGLRYE